MMKMKSGCNIPAQVKEGYMVQKNHIIANVGVDKIEAVFQYFIAMHDEPLFFILELPSNVKYETETIPGTVTTFHKDVYYIDGCSQEQARTILLHTGELLYNDGISSFGFGCHNSGDEAMFGQYNVLTVFSRHIEQYNSFFEFHDIPQDSNLITAWDTFSDERPGESNRITVNGKDVFAIPKQFKDKGMYLAERREE